MINDALQSYLASSPTDRPVAFRKLLALLKSAAAENPDGAASTLRRSLRPDMDYSEVDALVRVRKLVRKHLPAKPTRRIAILGGFTTHQLCGFIELFLFGHGIEVELYESDYDVFRQEILDASSQLHEFRPDIVYLAVNRRNLGRMPKFDESAARVRELIEEELEEWSALWRTANRQLNCLVLQNGFDLPASRLLNNHEMRHHAGASRFLSRLNEILQEEAPAYVTIHDVDHLAASAGRWAWGDERFYYHAKLPCAPPFLVPYAHSVASVIAALSGESKKCLVLDLDNTLWGGVIGDDGIEKIRLGQGDAEGEAFLAFQRYVLGLRHRGVILAVCSKNTDSVAREAFEKHTEMALRLDDISFFCANWDDKATNLRKIAAQLEIGLNSLVFVDDNPMERALVRQYCPEVAVPELPEDPSGYIEAIEKHAYFQTVSVGSEDLRRTEMYRANAQRDQAESQVGNIDEFLTSLQMKARVEPVNDANLARVVQLIGRSNQFNLTTRRHSVAAVSAMMLDDAFLTRAISLADRYGDNGLISVILCRIERETLIVDTWLMSCRVLKRSVEAFVLNMLAAEARRRKLTAIAGEYIPTAKNALVRDHYASLGFEKVSVDAGGRAAEGHTPDGHTCWRLSLDTAPVLPTFIQES